MRAGGNDMMLLHTLHPCNINAIAMTTVTPSEIIHLQNYGMSSEGKIYLHLAGKLLLSTISLIALSTQASSTTPSSKGYLINQFLSCVRPKVNHSSLLPQ